MLAGWGRSTHKISNPIFTTEDTEVSEKTPEKVFLSELCVLCGKTVCCSARLAQALLFAEAGADLCLDPLGIQPGFGQ